ncbi:gamma-glutamyltranspeptidase periplasmic precursor [Aspergillus udagawae]|uniref:Gamma-glutamyltranspeptidase periplasmic n=1 Tax=Aspergillus udagawae TaxID=91492 RepID=A0ABQ1BCQ9_9EURO|nr:gamma-glutamyltranspeptidase periplasmic precursor [Aspergillus udagawae]
MTCSVLTEAAESHLSAQKYGYDFVASTSQKSIAAHMLRSMTKVDVAGAWYFFSSNSGERYHVCGQEEALKKTHGVDPLDPAQCPGTMPTDDSKYLTLYNAGFAFACDFTLGLPLGMTGDKLPQPCIILCEETDKIVLSVFFSEVTIVQARNDSGGKLWARSSQQRGTPWYITIKLNIAQEPLPSIKDDPYFKRHPDAAEEIQNRVRQGGNLTPAFRQVVLNWNNSQVIGAESQGTPDGTVGNVRSALSYAAGKLDGAGLAPLCVLAAKSNLSEGIPLITSCDWRVTPYPGDAGVSTLDILCMIDGHSLPGRPHPDFDWHWMQPGDIEQKIHGVSSINGTVIANIIRTECWDKIAKTFCAVFKCDLNDYPTMAILSSDPVPGEAVVQPLPSPGVLLRVEYATQDDASHGSAKLEVDYLYTLEVTCSPKSSTVLTVSQDVKALLTFTYDSHASISKITAWNEDSYALSVNSKGDLDTEWIPGRPESPKLDFVPHGSWPYDFKAAAEACATVFFQDTFKPKIGDRVLDVLPLSKLNNFVFPGGQVYSFKNPSVSKYSDLLCGLTYRPPKPLSNELLGHLQDDAENAALPDSSLVLSSSSDYMQNYIPGEAVDLVGKTSKFEALQAKNGNSLVLAIDTSGTLNIVQEQSGLLSMENGDGEGSKLGWLLSPLSPKNASVITFAASQNAVTGAISLAMVAESGGRETLFTSLGNSSADLSWIKKPNWRPIEFDAKSPAPSKLHIAGILFAEASREYLIVDIDRPENKTTYIERYHIDSSPGPGEKHWKVHDVPGDISRIGYQSCVGRVKGERVDGVYTSGVEGGSAQGNRQLCYQGIENIWDPTIPDEPRWLFLPNGNEPLSPMAVATIRHAEPTLDPNRLATTDLYAVANSNLYRWDAAKQDDGACAQVLIKGKKLLSGTHTLLGMAHDGIAILWGVNSSNQLYTMSCDMNHVSDPEKWSAPFPVALGIERLSAFVNAVDGGNTIFAYAGQDAPRKRGSPRLIRLTKESGGSRLWKSQSIILPLPPSKPSIPIMSYTTSLSVTDMSGHSVPAARMSISTNSRTAVYINGHYHILSKEATHVKADTSGTVTVVEATENLSAAALTVSLDGNAEGTTEIKPYADNYNKIRQLETKEALRSAMVPDRAHIVAGGFWETAPRQSLIPSRIPDDAVNVASDIIGEFNKMHPSGAYSPTITTREDVRVIPASCHPAASSVLGEDNGVWTDIGDFFRSAWEAFKHGIEVGVKWIYDEANKAYHVIVKILDETYEAIVKTIEDIVAGIIWVFNQIVDFIEDIYHFLQILFEWSDIQRTKDVFQKVVTVWLNHQVDLVPEGKKLLDDHITAAINAVDKWAGISHDWDRLGDPSKHTAKESSTDPESGQTSASRLLSKHLQNHIGEISLANDEPLPQIPESVIHDIVAGLPANAPDNSIQDIYDQLCALASDFKDMSIGKFLTRLAGILTGAALQAVKAVADVVLDALTKIARSAVKILDTKIHIPIISDILSALHISDISFLDLFMWIAAVAYTVVYKLANHNSSPFTKEFANAVTSASTWEQLLKLFHPALEGPGAHTASANLPAMFHGGHGGAGIAGISTAILQTLEAALPAGESKLLTYSSIAAGVLSAVLAGVTDAVVPVEAVENKDIVTLSTFKVAYVILWGLACGAAGDQMVTPIAKTTGIKFINGRGAGAVVGAVLTIPAFIVSGYHFYELSQKSASVKRSASIIGEVSSVTGSIAKLAYAVAVNSEGQVKEAAVALLGVCDVATAGLQIAEAALPY